MSELISFFDEMLATTRSVRRRIDFTREIEPALIYDCIDLAVQAPSSVGGESWRFVVLTEQPRKDAMAELYRKSFDSFLAIQHAESLAQGQPIQALPPNYRYLADRMQDFPAIIVVCREGWPAAVLPVEHMKDATLRRALRSLARAGSARIYKHEVERPCRADRR